MPQNNQAFDIVMTQRWGRVFLELLSKSVIYNQAIHRNIFLDILNKPSKQIPRFTAHTARIPRQKVMAYLDRGVRLFREFPIYIGFMVYQTFELAEGREEVDGSSSIFKPLFDHKQLCSMHIHATNSPIYSFYGNACRPTEYKQNPVKISLFFNSF